MQNLSILETLAEVSIGLIGFAGVVSALGWSRLPPLMKSFRVQALLLYGITALTGSLFPLIFDRFDLKVDVVWIASAALLLAGQLGILFHLTFVLRRLVRIGHLPGSLALIVSTISIGSMLFVLYGVLFRNSSLPAIYLVGVSASLGLGVFHFFMLVISIQSGEHDESNS